MSRDLSYLETLEVDELKEAILVLEKAESVSGPTVKKELILEHKDNQVLQEFFFRALGTEKYNLRLKADEVISSEDRMGLVASFKTFIGKVLPALAERQFGDKEARARVVSFLSRCNPRVRKWYLRLLMHDLKIGVARTTINKVYGTGFWFGVAEDEFHFHGCCLAKKFEDAYAKTEPKFPLAVEYKLDGERALLFVFPDSDDLHIYTRGLLRKTAIEGSETLKQECFEIAEKINGYRGKPAGDPIFLDGEFLAETWNDTSSVVGKTKTFDEETFLAATKVLLFDWSPIDAYMDREFSMPWKDRKMLLMRATGAQRPYLKVRPITEHIFVLGHKRVRSMEELNAFHDAAYDMGFEGTMVKDPLAPHRFDRKHKFVLKLKPEDAATGIIKDALPGEGSNGPASPSDLKKVRVAMSELGVIEDDGYYLHLETADPEGVLDDLRENVIDDWGDRRLSAHLDDTVSYRYSERLGAFSVEYNGAEFNVGGGFTFAAGNDQRMEYWQKRDELIGMPVDFKFQKDKVAVAKARFNGFVRLRFDLAKNKKNTEDVD